MNGYSSNRGRGGPTGMFHSTQQMITTVIPTRNRAVPMKRAKPSANFPKASRSSLSLAGSTAGAGRECSVAPGRAPP